MQKVFIKQNIFRYNVIWMCSCVQELLRNYRNDSEELPVSAVCTDSSSVRTHLRSSLSDSRDLVLGV